MSADIGESTLSVANLGHELLRIIVQHPRYLILDVYILCKKKICVFPIGDIQLISCLGIATDLCQVHISGFRTICLAHVCLSLNQE